MCFFSNFQIALFILFYFYITHYSVPLQTFNYSLTVIAPILLKLNALRITSGH